jgi:Protein of unknown function (DUF789)
VDLWDQYYEWSAYDIGTHAYMSIAETMVQYYVSYLPVIQLYTTTSKLVMYAF